MERKPIAIAVRMVITGALAGTLAACGGGGSGDSTTSGTSSGTSVGAVSGFGSVYVNGTRFAEEIDDGDDWFSDDDDDVEITGSIYDHDAARRQFSVNGVAVQITGGTEFDDLGESSLADGLFVKVEGDFRDGILVAGVGPQLALDVDMGIQSQT